MSEKLTLRNVDGRIAGVDEDGAEVPIDLGSVRAESAAIGAGDETAPLELIHEATGETFTFHPTGAFEPMELLLGSVGLGQFDFGVVDHGTVGEDRSSSVEVAFEEPFGGVPTAITCWGDTADAGAATSSPQRAWIERLDERGFVHRVYNGASSPRTARACGWIAFGSRP